MELDTLRCLNFVEEMESKSPYDSTSNDSTNAQYEDWPLLQPSLQLSKAALDQVEYFYRRLREQQNLVLSHPVNPQNLDYLKFCCQMRIFYNGPLVNLQTKLYFGNPAREQILREIVDLTYRNITKFYYALPDAWETMHLLLNANLATIRDDAPFARCN